MHALCGKTFRKRELCIKYEINAVNIGVKREPIHILESGVVMQMFAGVFVIDVCNHSVCISVNIE